MTERNIRGIAHTVLALFLVSLYAGCQVIRPEPAEPWAPAVDRPDLDISALPTGDEVPFPAYPGARVHNTVRRGPDPESIRVFMVTSDSPDDVYAYYRNWIGEGWQAAPSEYSGYEYLMWEGPPNHQTTALAGRIPSIHIRWLRERELEVMRDWHPDPRTEIVVVYFPNE